MTTTDMYFSNHMREWLKQPVKEQSSLQTAIAFIRKHIPPDEVYPQRELITYIEDHKDALENKLPVNY